MDVANSCDLDNIISRRSIKVRAVKMSNLVDRIERYLKKVLEDTPDGFIVIQRSGLAIKFECAPSQINYVLTTRFSEEQGYLVESRRGGGGYLRIVKLALEKSDYLDAAIGQLSSGELNQNSAAGLIKRLEEEEILTKREAMLIRAVVDRNILGMEVRARDRLRSRIIAAILRTIAREDF